MTNRKDNHFRTLAFQQLENRMLMAGNVTAAVSKGSLIITGDTAANEIQITQVRSGVYRIASFDGTTKINGHSADQTFFGVTADVNIDLKAGADVLVVGDGALGEATQFMSLPRNLNVNLGAGDNSFTMLGTTVKGRASISGGADGNALDFIESAIGTTAVNGGANDCTISFGAGDNRIFLNYTPIERDLNILDQASHSDNIAVDGGNIGRYLYIQTGNGDDHVQMDELNVGFQIHVKTGAGVDKVVLGGYDADVTDAPYASPVGVVADQVLIDMGGNGDTLQVGGSHDSRGTGGLTANEILVFLDGGSVLFDNYGPASQIFFENGSLSLTGMEAQADRYFGSLGSATQTATAQR